MKVDERHQLVVGALERAVGAPTDAF